MKTITNIAAGILIVLISGCGKQDCVDYQITNFTENTIHLMLYEGDFLNSKTPIGRGSENSYTALNVCENNLSLGYGIFDSVEIRVNDVVRKTYYPSTEGKNIYNVDDPDSWEIVERRSNYSKYVFSVLEEDLE